MSCPLASIIIPTYNRKATIERAVASALSQTYSRIEVIVIDDGSTDGTVSVLEQYRGRVRVVLQPNSGPSAARNRGARESAGEILAFLDSDDVWLPEKIERQVEMMYSGEEEFQCCVCNAEIRQLDGGIDSSFHNARLRVTEPVSWLNPGEILATRFLLFNQVVAVRRTAFEAVGGFNESLRVLEDYDIAMRLSKVGPWAMLPDILVVKYNEAGGIGVQAMQNQLEHMRAAKHVIEGLLATTFDSAGGPSVERKLLVNALREICEGLEARQKLDCGSFLRSSMGKLHLLWLRYRNSLSRRTLNRVAMNVKPVSRKRLCSTC